MKEIRSDIRYTDMGTMLKECISDVEARAICKDYPGISTGFEPLDELVGGFEKGKVYVVGGRPCMGKEELMLSMIVDIV